MVTKTLSGPQGIRIELDSAQIFPDDPGQGTPAMVHLGRESCTFQWACGEGYMYSDHGDEEKPFTSAQMAWLEAQADTVSDFIDGNAPND